MKNVDLQQDEYSLSNPTFPTPRGGILTVVGWEGKSGSNKKYVVRCSICSGDHELFGDGTFSSLKSNLTMGRSPCGCAFNPKWSEHQYRVRVSREAKSRGFKFIGWSEAYKGIHTKVLLSCPLHGEWNSTSIDNFLRGKGCSACRADRAREAHLMEDSLHIESFMKTGAFLEGTKFRRSEKKSSQGKSVYWNYTCPLCSHDEYVQEGLCSGVFESYSGHMKKGWLSCRCSKSYHWTKEQREYQIKKEMSRRRNNNTADYNFVWWKDEYKSFRSKFKYICKEHGEQIISVGNFLEGQGCPQCTGKTQRQAYINVVIDGDIPVALKLGIANESKSRLKRQNQKSLFQMTNLGVWEFPTVKSCKKAESECKRKLQCGILTVKELKDGWTETTSLLNLEEIISIYRKHGGSAVPTANP